MDTDFQDLLRSIRRVSSGLLPTPSATARYSDGEVLRMYSFRLLAHAEIEGFIESLASEMATLLFDRAQRGVLRAAARERLLHHCYLAENYPPRNITRTMLPDAAKKPICALLKNVQGQIEVNNGVSEKDVLKLFLPLGIELSFFDKRWLLAMTGLAQARGEVAHNSWQMASTRQQPSPQEERGRLVVPLLGIRALCGTAADMMKLA